MNDFELRKIFQNTRTIAAVGCSKDPEKAAHYVPEYLIAQGYTVIPVNPTADEILGQKCYPDLPSIGKPVDVVQIFRPSADVPPIVDQAIRIGAKVVWMQQGIVNEEAAQAARNAGLAVIMDHCMMVEHNRLIGPRP